MNTDTESSPVAMPQKTAPPKKLEIAAFTAAILSIAFSAVCLILLLVLTTLDTLTYNVLWWGGWGLVAVAMVIKLSLSPKRFLQTKQLTLASLLAFCSAIILLVCTFLD